MRVEEPDSAKKQKRGEKWMWESSCTPAERANKGKEKSIQSADTLWEPMASGNLWSPSEVGSEEPDQRSGSCGRVWWSSSLQAPVSLSAFCFPLSNVPVSLGWICTVSAVQRKCYPLPLSISVILTPFNLLSTVIYTYYSAQNFHSIAE